jgi:hypothetical protein
MIVFRNIKLFERADFGYILPTPQSRLFRFRNRFEGDFFLPFIVIKNHGAILRADIIALSVKRRWVVRMSKHIKDFSEGNFLRVKGNLHDFGVSRCALADLLVSRIFNRAAAVS